MECKVCSRIIHTSEALASSGGNESGQKVTCQCGEVYRVIVHWQPHFIVHHVKKRKQPAK